MQDKALQILPAFRLFSAEINPYNRVFFGSTGTDVE